MERSPVGEFEGRVQGMNDSGLFFNMSVTPCPFIGISGVESVSLTPVVGMDYGIM
jgi:hypothetical protein